MKLKIITLLFLFLGSAFANAQDRGSDKVRKSPNAMVSQTIGTTVVTITYGRPSLKGRSTDTLAPAGKVWRTGANESAAITFSGDVQFGGEDIAAGTYSLYSIPGAEEWTFIINSALSWGTRYDEANDVVRTTGSVYEVDAVESFTISFDTLSAEGAHLVLSWGITAAAVPITVSSN